MSNERGRNAQKREDKKNRRLKRFVGIELCACGGGHKLKCEGECRDHHTKDNGLVECISIYKIDDSMIGKDKSKRSKRTFKYGKQRDGDENQRAKQNRREKLEKDG